MNSLAARPASASLRGSLKPKLSAARAGRPLSTGPRRTTTTCAFVVAGVPIPIPELNPDGGPPYAIYAALGAAAASFAGTFFVAPQFKDQFRQASLCWVVDSEMLTPPAWAARSRRRRFNALYRDFNCLFTSCDAVLTNPRGSG